MKKNLIVLIIASISLVYAFSTGNIEAESAVFGVHNINTGLNYSSIQAAINAPQTLAGHTIVVDSGVYREKVIVSKALFIKGGSPETTSLSYPSGSDTAGESLLKLQKSHSSISGFAFHTNIGSSAGGISVEAQSVEVSHNLMEGGAWGVHALPPLFEYCLYLNITANTVMSSERGIYLDNVKQSLIQGNSISNCSSSGISLYRNAYDNVISNNVLDGNLVGIYQEWGANNRIILNDFKNNNKNVQLTSNTVINYWDNGAKGNYWSNYYFIDRNHDGIGDTPYVIDASNQDNFPLMTPAVPEFPSSLLLIASIMATLFVAMVQRKSIGDKGKKSIDFFE